MLNSLQGPLFLTKFLSFSFAATSSAAIPGSFAECPASATTYHLYSSLVLHVSNIKGQLLQIQLKN